MPRRKFGHPCPYCSSTVTRVIRTGRKLREHTVVHRSLCECSSCNRRFRVAGEVHSEMMRQAGGKPL
jgi:transcriptional regulator NrdR family protein